MRVVATNREGRSKVREPSGRRLWFTQRIVASVAVVFGAGSMASPMASAVDCTGDPMFVTPDCVDPHYTQPYIDIDEQRTTPAPHRYVHGGFTGTDTRFSIYLPPAEQYQGRFFQNTHQLLNSENAGASTVGFALASGAYYVQSNIGGNERCTNAECVVLGGLDGTIGSYRANAAAAQFSKTVAAQVYGPHRTYGYLYSGSGGAYQTIGSAENTSGVWDGFVPYVMGTPNSVPTVFTVRIHALRVLKKNNKFPAVMDAIDPGGSGDPYAGLSEEEAGALREATRMGFPPRGWWNHVSLNGGPLSLVAGFVPLLDASYFTDYWDDPGYLGHDDPYGSVAAARVQDAPGARTVVAKNGPFLVLDTVPPGDLLGAELFVDSGAAAGQHWTLLLVNGNAVLPAGANLALIQVGDLVHIDNSNHLALQTYQRHQVPTPDMYGWNVFRGPDGTPIYPQRDVLIGPYSRAYDRTLQNGQINGKVIVLQTLMDIDAFPWQADWYRTQVKNAKGKKFEDSYRLYFHDFAQHGAPSGNAANARTVSYQGALEQAIRDVSAWVETGKKPAASTVYSVDAETQVQLPPTAGARKGIQPVVWLTVNGGKRADISVGQTVTFSANITVPTGAGRVVAAEWDFLGVGNYPVSAQITPTASVDALTATFTYDQPGTYFPVLRATSQREGDPATPWARVQNLDRVRVVVH